MRATDAYADLLRFGRPVVTTDDAAVRLCLTSSAASRLLARLSRSGLVLPLRHGLWSLKLDLDPLVLPEHLTAPLPAYVSLQTALYYHDMINQIPQVIYVASTARTRRVATRLGTYSVHSLPPALMGGYVTTGEVHLATPEKALIDLLYLSNTRSRLFAWLPELELPAAFSFDEAERWQAAIPSQMKRTMVRDRLRRLIATPGVAALLHRRRR